MSGWRVYDEIRADLDQLKRDLDDLAVDIAAWRRCHGVTKSGEQCRSNWPKGQSSVNTVYFCRRHWPKDQPRFEP